MADAIEELRRMLRRIEAVLRDAERREIRDESVELWLTELKGLAYDMEDVLEEVGYEFLRFQVENKEMISPPLQKELFFDEIQRKLEGMLSGSPITVESEHHRAHKLKGILSGSPIIGGSEHHRPRKLKGILSRSPIIGQSEHHRLHESISSGNPITGGSEHHRVRESISSPPSNEILSFLDDQAPRISEIRERFDRIAHVRDALHLTEADGVRRVEYTARPPTTSFPEEPCIVGRENDRKKIIEMLLSDEECNFSVISIVGMPGIGKTTLAQLVYNDDTIDEHFDLKAWVCVSKDFDAIRLTKAILESLLIKSCDFVTLHPLQVKLQAELAGKKFLFVLDDVWNESQSHWETLRAPLLRGAKGSKVIVTTRFKGISRKMGANSPYDLGCLSENDCWSLFSHRASDEGCVLDPKLEAIGKQIALKCKGLPLLAKTFGGLLRFEDDEKKWLDILESDIWDIAEGRKDILPILRLSYHSLPPHLKRCFTFCSIFPKGWMFEKDKLVRMWMAHGFIQPTARKEPEEIGNEYFDELFWRSFFQPLQESSESMVPEGLLFMMHDLIHDLAQYFSGEECSRIKIDELHNISRNARHLSVVCYDFTSIVSLEPLKKYTSLRTVSVSSMREDSAQYSLIPSDPFHSLKYLRVLDVGFTEIRKLPDSVGNLKCLRYLGVNWTHIDQLPDSICSLYNLQTLDCSHSYIGVFPKAISNLFNLRHLIHNCSYLKFPVGIGRLTNLQTVPKLNMGKETDSAGIGELEDLNNIQELHINGLKCLIDEEDQAKKANLKSKKHLRTLKLYWSGFFLDCDEEVMNIGEKTLESLEPHTNLKELEICGFNGRTFPSWTWDPIFSKLVVINFFNCKNCTRLPRLGKLPSLKVLTITGFHSLERVGPEFFDGGFPSLEKLKLGHMSKLNAWSGAEKGECLRLHRLTIFTCDDLTSLPLTNLNSLKRFDIDGCYKLQFSLEEELPSTLQVLSIYRCPLLREWCQQNQLWLARISTIRGIGVASSVKIQDVVNVEEAKNANLKDLERLRELELLWDTESPAHLEEVLENLKPHTNLNNLVIQGYKGLRFASWLGDPSYHNLVTLKLLSCSESKALPPVGQLPNLQELFIEGMHGVQDIKFHETGTRKQFPWLRRLEFKDMNKWESWVMEEADLSSLRKLTIRNCPRLMGLPRLPPTLKDLELENCDAMINLGSLRDVTSLYTLRISQLPILKELRDLPCIQELIIEYCAELAQLPSLPSLRDLVLKESNEKMLLASLPHFTALSSLRISHFPKLKSLPLQNLMSLMNFTSQTVPSLHLLIVTVLLLHLMGHFSLRSILRLLPLSNAYPWKVALDSSFLPVKGCPPHLNICMSETVHC